MLDVDDHEGDRRDGVQQAYSAVLNASRYQREMRSVSRQHVQHNA